MILVTGGMGLVGSNLIKALNGLGHRNILIVDNLQNKFLRKKINIENLKYLELLDIKVFYSNPEIYLEKIEIIFHQGACTNTTETDLTKMNLLNFEYSKKLFDLANKHKIRFIYASSASVYGMGSQGFQIDPKCENPLNIYAESKLRFDNYIRNFLSSSDTQIAGLRYFNVYGYGESHKDFMASTIYHFYNQAKNDSEIRLFKSNDNEIPNGMQKRDFIYVDDCVKLNLKLYDNKNISGIFNSGTGQARPFFDVAKIIQKWFVEERGYKPSINFIDFPKKLENKYQNFTQSDNTNHDKLLHDMKFTTLESGVRNYLKNLKNENI